MSSEEPWRRFTPTEIHPNLCKSRTWAGGKGGQCTKAPVAGSVFCSTHSKGPPVHGRVDGPIPEGKLKEFEGAAAAALRPLSERKRKDPNEVSPIKPSKMAKLQPGDSTQEKPHVVRPQAKSVTSLPRMSSIPRSKVQKCNCNCLIHTEKCNLFKAKPAVFNLTKSFVPPAEGSGTKVMGGNRAVPRPSVLSSLPMPTFKSEWSLKQFQSIMKEVGSMTPKDGRAALKKKMLLYHPDKNVSAKNLDEMTELYIEVKRSFDLIPGD
eukprot:gnl/MRDRNA2_/MRDRNA2_105527_c0_seq1.p1 gnl/MRDRNA2_/MRDRNA2_105527_c0~~gnl/MRDRNA2_/MRDRNA2_105527_c0_seq1.p1  ORF type:complete len:265 (-),score=53.63 gnl/MRDRNA2_/MRDRNA2_105527_c0_seq1:106-900(-)